MSDKNNKLRTSKYNPVDKQRSRVGNKEFGVYVGEVISAVDLAKTGKLVVRISALTKDAEKNFTCKWSSPFAGSTPIYTTGDQITDFRQTQTSYGMWMVPPDPGNLVLVVFAEGNLSEPYVIGCLHNDRYHNMVPGIPAGTSYGDPNMLAPVAEKNKRSQPNIHDNAVRPMHADLARNITKQGLINDFRRGAGDGGSRRESPSEIFGILTPGALDESDTEFFSRLAGHQFIMDDNVFSRMIRIRSGGGSQILLNDVDNTIYMINANGECWFEMDSNGAMNFYAQNGINIRTNGNYNVRADGDVNIEAGRNVNIKAAGDMEENNYVGGADQETDFNTNPPPGQGGEVNITAKDSIHAMGDQNVYITSAAQDIQLNSGRATDITANGASGNGAAININTPGQGGIALTSSTRLTLDANDIGGTADIINFGGGQILLNSGAPTVYQPQTAIRANRLRGVASPDVSTVKPEFDFVAATRGEPAIPNGGQRPVAAPPVYTIASTLVTPEPFPDHKQYDPLRVVDGPVVSESEISSTPPGSVTVQNSTTPVNQAGLDGVFRRGVEVASGVAVYDQISGVVNNMSSASTKRLTGNTNTSAQAHARATAAAQRNIQGEVSQSGENLLGYGTRVGDIELQQRRAGLNRNNQLDSINGGALGALNASLMDLASQAGTDDEQFAQLLEQNQITVSKLGGPSGNTVYTDRSGNSIIDYSGGLTDQAATVLNLSDLQRIWDDIRTQIPFVILTDNQAVCLADFARDLGDRFQESNVMQLLRQANQLGDESRASYNPDQMVTLLSGVPRLMSGWILAARKPGGKRVRDEGLRAKREYQIALWQTPDGAMPQFSQDLLSNGPNWSGASYPTVTAALLGATESYLMTKPNLGKIESRTQ